MIVFNAYKKFLSLLIFIIISITAFSIFSTNDNNSYSVESQNPTNNDFNIITTADIGCSLRAQENT